MKSYENQLPFWRRFLIYQKERFPFISHGILIAVFTFSAIAYSRICSGEEGFILWQDYLIGFCTTLSLFFLLRILDEFKDQSEDARYRKELPVPRGLISLKELKWVGLAVFGLQISLVMIFHAAVFSIYFIVISYLALMTVEFFIPRWLKKNQLAYIGSHMMIIPLIDLYASGLDWQLSGRSPHYGLLFFLAVSFFNGIVLEFGRKIRAPESEKEGVLSYTKMYGTKKGTILWWALLAFTGLLAASACYFAGLAMLSYLVLGFCFLLCSLPALRFIRHPEAKKEKHIEWASGLWTIMMYATLGGIPGLLYL